MSSYTLAITPAVPSSETSMLVFDRAIQALHKHTPLAFVRWDQTATPTIYTYTIRAVDGRTFAQTYDYADPAVASTELPSFSTSGSKWSKVEIDLHRDIRATLLLIVAARGVTSLHATFT